eukprot:gene36360-58288_t
MPAGEPAGVPGPRDQLPPAQTPSGVSSSVGAWAMEARDAPRSASPTPAATRPSLSVGGGGGAGGRPVGAAAAVAASHITLVAGCGVALCTAAVVLG